MNSSVLRTGAARALNALLLRYRQDHLFFSKQSGSSSLATTQPLLVRFLPRSRKRILAPGGVFSAR